MLILKSIVNKDKNCGTYHATQLTDVVECGYGKNGPRSENRANIC